jgi:hypothetical protein
MCSCDFAKLKRYKSPVNDQIQAGGETLWSEVNKLINSVWNKKEFPDQWKESFIVPIYKKGDKTVSGIYHGISLLSTSCKILSNILPSRLSSYIDRITGDHHCGFSTSAIHRL